MRIQGVNHNICSKSSSKKLSSKPNFTSDYQVDLSTAYTRPQILTLGMLMNNFWIDNVRYTFQEMKYSGVYGPIKFKVKNARDSAFEQIMKNQNISYKKLNNNTQYY